jgi:hypothetical protein
MSAVSEKQLPTTRITLTNGNKVKIFIKHDQNVKENSRGLPVKGSTLAQLFDENGNLISVGHAYCNLCDNFVRHEGVKHAVRRALEQAKLAKPDRSAVWQKVLNRHATKA